MDIKRLKSFITIVDTGSITRAADVLNIAQPALSQQLSALEEHFQQKLVTRSQAGVTLTDAGKVVYHHSQVILRQVEQARVEVCGASVLCAGKVSVGLTPFSSATTLTVRLMEETRRLYPNIVLQITESVIQPHSQMIRNGHLEIGLIHGTGPVSGVKYQPVLREELVLLVHEALGIEPETRPATISEIAGLSFLLPPPYNFVRRAVEFAFIRERMSVSVAAELESVAALVSGIEAGIGATLIPRALAEAIAAESRENLVIRQIAGPAMEETLSLCTSDRTPLSEPALAVKDILLRLAATLDTSNAAPVRELSAVL